MNAAEPARPGLLVVDKPAGWTSHDVVAVVRRLAGTRKVGHAGTLDPMATGVLVLGIGSGTRLLGHLVGLDKTYVATVRLGQATTTDDAEGQVVSGTGVTDLDPDRLAAALARLRGPIDQVPSAVSAIKVDGRRAYQRVRAGESVELAARPVVVHRLVAGPARPARAADGTAVVDLDLEADVSSGTYIRALARDLGAALGVGGHLTALRRTRVGPFLLSQAHLLGGVVAGVTDPPLDVSAALLPLAQAATARFPAYLLEESQAQALTHGRFVPAPELADGAVAAAIGPDGQLVALVEGRAGLARPTAVFGAR